MSKAAPSASMRLHRRLTAKYQRAVSSFVGVQLDAQGISQSQLARDISLHHSAVCRMCSGDRGVDPPRLAMIAKALGYRLEMTLVPVSSDDEPVRVL